MYFSIGYAKRTCAEVCEDACINPPTRGQAISILNHRQIFWFPHIDVGHSNWANTFDQRSFLITELNIKEPDVHYDNAMNDNRDKITFGKVNGLYEFLGVYTVDKQASQHSKPTVVYRRVTNKFTC